MLKSADAALLRRVDPRKGVFVAQWGPKDAQRIDRLVEAGVISWHTEQQGRRMGMRLVLTVKGQIVRRKPLAG